MFSIISSTRKFFKTSLTFLSRRREQKIINHIQGFHLTRQRKKFVVIHTLEDENNSWAMVVKKTGQVMVSSWYDVPYLMLISCLVLDSFSCFLNLCIACLVCPHPIEKQHDNIFMVVFFSSFSGLLYARPDKYYSRSSFLFI